MASVVDERAEHPAGLAVRRFRRHTADHQRVVRKARRMEAAHILLARGVVAVAVYGEVRAAGAAGEHGRHARGVGLFRTLRDALRHLVEIRSDHVAAGQVGARAGHEPGAVRVRKTNVNLRRGNAGRVRGRLANAIDHGTL